MSVKIYNGYRFPVIDDIEDQLDDIGGNHLTPVGSELLAQHEVQLAVRFHDGLPYLPPFPDMSDCSGLAISPLLRAAECIDERREHVAESEYRDTEYDLSIDVAIWDLHDDWLYLTWTAEASQLGAALTSSIPGIEPWPYWNNADKPDDVTVEEWQDRAKIWYRTTITPPHTRWIWNTYRGAFDYHDGDPTKFIPSIEDRAEALAWEIFYQTRDAELGPVSLSGGSTVEAMNRIGSIAAEFAELSDQLTAIQAAQLEPIRWEQLVGGFTIPPTSLP